MSGPNAWGTIVQTAKRSPPIESLKELEQAVRESHEGFGMMAAAGDLVLATPTGVDIKDVEQAKATVSILVHSPIPSTCLAGASVDVLAACLVAVSAR